MTTTKHTETQGPEAEAIFPLWRWHLWEIGYGSYEDIEAALISGALQVFTCYKADCDCKWPKVKATLPLNSELPPPVRVWVSKCDDAVTLSGVSQSVAQTADFYRQEYVREDLAATPTVDPAMISLAAREVIDLIQDEYEHGAAGIEPGIVAILSKHFGVGKREGDDA
jgi:hypothetical protein